MGAVWDHTKVMLDRLKEKIDWIDGIPTYEGRRVIHRDSPIDGGVYLGKHQREAIVVDSEKYPKLKEMYQTAIKKLVPKKYDGDTGKKIFDEDDILLTVFNLVKETMPPDANAFDRLDMLLDELDINEDKKVGIDTFLNYGVGICRHHALAIGAILELFKKDGHLKGNISVDRNSTYMGGHGWCKYNNNNETIILDVALGYFGRISDAPESGRWAYERPDWI